MKTEARYPVMVGLKIPRDLADEIQRRAREDDRPVSSFLRRTLAAALRSDADHEKSATK